MCTLALAIGTDRRWPLVVAANRDERLSRASEPWALRSPAAGTAPSSDAAGTSPAHPATAASALALARAAMGGSGGAADSAGKTGLAGGTTLPTAMLAPRDVVAGGTWIGLSAAGVFAAVTNVHTGELPDLSLRSRGELVGLALAHPSAAAALTALGDVPGTAFNPFHLVVADRASAFLWRHDGSSPPSFAPLESGLHVITERGADGHDPRALAVRAAWPIDLAPAKLGALLASHGPGEPICVHLGEAYGTRSSTVLRLAADVALSELWTSDGPPCRTPLEDRAALVAALARRA